MKLLAIDTTASACSAALLLDEDIKLLFEHAPMQQSQLILSMISTLLSSNNTNINQLDAIAFACGPGSFTGIRIAASVVQGLAFGLNLPVIPISSLAATAQAAFNDLCWDSLWVATDGRMNQLYWGSYQVKSGELVELVGTEIVSSPEAIKATNKNNWYGIGDAWKVYRETLNLAPKAIDDTRLPRADAVAQLAKDKFLKKEWVTASEALPVYLRDEVAVKAKKR